MQLLTMRRSFRLGMALAATSGTFAGPAVAVDFQIADFDVTAHGGVTYGTTVRTDSRDARLLPPGNGTRVGHRGSAAGGNNNDDGDLNFGRGDTVSTVTKAVGSVDIHRNGAGLVVRAKLWHDLVLGESNAAFGNLPNGLAANRPLGDGGFPDRAKFSGAAFQDVYVYGNFTPWEKALTVRLGNQTLPWGSGWSIGGGLSALNPLDLPAIRRAGALPEEMPVPVPALFGKLSLSEQTALEGFYQIRFRRTELDGCGTFFSTYDYVTPGCNRVVVAAPFSPVPDPTALAAGFRGARAPTPEVSDSGQLGIGVTYKAVDIATDFGAYLSQYHNRTPVVSAIRTTRAIPVPFIPGNPDGANPAYFTEYPERVRMLGLTFATRMDGLTVAGELTYRPNQPVVFNATELLRAFVSNTAPTTLRADASATPLGGVFHGYDRRRVTQLQLSANGTLHPILGADEMPLAAEVGMKYMNDLPNAAIRRYGRQDNFGVGPVGGACEPGSTAEQCTLRGFVSKSAWGYRLKAGLKYSGIADAVDFTPSITFAHDVRGWSYDNVFNEGRHTLWLSLRATYRKMYFADITFAPTGGGDYNNARDRGYAAAAVGLRF